jgi:hypothetical protein
MFQFVTDGTTTSAGILRKFQVIAEHGGYVWVKCPDGTMKTYHKNQLEKVS